MINIQQLIDRYKNIVPSYYSVMGYLMWGGKDFYIMNSNTPVSLNRDSNNFITNKTGLVEEYDINTEAPYILYFEDLEHTKEISWERFYELFGDDEDRYKLYTKDNPTRCKKTYRLPLSGYYSHPWFPGKDISHFEVIRIMPGLILGDDVTPESYQKEQYYLQYPEFFKPIYK